MKINENIAYSRSILNKLNINQDSELYNDYLKIREICGSNHGYVGILTKIRFIDGVEDMDEIKSIFDVLKNSKIDINKLNKLSYQEILEIFYEELGGKVDKTDLELYYKDEQYSYYKVYTYKGILKIGSPAWCLKTKSKWDEYQSFYPEQWVIIDNRYKNRLLSPDTTYLNNYSNTSKPWVRYGLSLRHNSDSTISWLGNDDNNGEVNYKPESWTFFGVLTTLLNLTNGNKKSYYESFRGCEKFNEKWLKVINKEKFCERMKIKEDNFNDDDEVYVFFSKSYSFIPVIFILNEYSFNTFFPTTKNNEGDYFVNKPVDITTDHPILLHYASKSDDQFYSGVKLKNGLTTLEEIEKDERFIKKVDKWLIFNRNSNYYLIVNTLEGDDKLFIPSHTLVKGNYEMDNPMCWYLDKKTMKPLKSSIKDFHELVIKSLKTENIEKEEEPRKKVKGFFDFLKRK
jgi:hypothetical protein